MGKINFSVYILYIKIKIDNTLVFIIVKKDYYQKIYYLSICILFIVTIFFNWYYN
jgi:hypothetical protein